MTHVDFPFEAISIPVFCNDRQEPVAPVFPEDVLHISEVAGHFFCLPIFGLYDSWIAASRTLQDLDRVPLLTVLLGLKNGLFAGERVGRG